MNKERLFTMEDVVSAISKNMCINCGKVLNKSLGRKDWHIPLCTNCRMDYLGDYHTHSKRGERGRDAVKEVS